jgi:hypothetical protein
LPALVPAEFSENKQDIDKQTVDFISLPEFIFRNAKILYLNLCNINSDDFAKETPGISYF